ncbi:HAMP domain-containing sensor histidine kinase [Peribacillus sp. FSL M8-0224]|uniref:HAMP domain-containing sensor histidine kinase n=1 Tax=Peribacillus sp. FSL M8-0224 TaxID=2921568 RepID=UPI0030FB0501|nr:HAMP domain-containing histidine kinase [Brevibacterium sp. PAMC21349]
MKKIKINSIGSKLGITIMILFMFILVPLGYVIDRIFFGFYYGQTHEYIDEVSLDIINSISYLDDQNELGLYEKMANHTKTELVIVDKAGKVLTTSNLYEKGEGFNPDLLSKIKKTNKIHQDYVDPKTKNYYFLSGRPIIINENFEGGVFVFSSLDSIHDSIHKLRTYLVIAILGALLLAAGFTFFVSKKLSKPLIDMEKITRRISKGDLNINIKKTSNDEIGSLAQAINDLAIELKEYRTNRSEFLANISHELRTPISYLSGYASVIRKNLYNNDQEKEEYLAIIENEASRLTLLINDLFELSKMEENKIELYKEWIDVEELIEGVLNRSKLSANKKNVILKYEPGKHLKMILSDGMRLEQILTNLIENSIRYTNHGGIVITSRANKDFVIITIKDSGIGIPPNDLPFIFERFYRVEKSRSRQMGGTGLGLAIVRELVNVLGGTIEVNSAVGQGTEFIITLPIEV